MLIVCTKDLTIRNAAANVVDWGAVRMVPINSSQANATTALQNFLAAAGPNEDLCFSAHGNNTEIGDEQSPWGWDTGDIATLLSNFAAGGQWTGRVLFHVCCTSVANFSAGAAVALGNLGDHNIWCYGYNRAVGATEGFPPPASLDTNVSLQATMS